MRLLASMVLASVVTLTTLLHEVVQAEPYFAVQQGMKCSACHVNPTGGGMRNEYGNMWAQMTLAARKLEVQDEPWSGRLNQHMAVGGNLRSSAAYIEVPNQETQQFFEVDEARVFLYFTPVPGRLGIYLDQHFAPGGSRNLEAYARFASRGNDWYVKAGQMFLPYGLRLEDDTAFIRLVPGINFTTPDRGVEAGWESARWSAQLAVSNGTAGGSEIDTGKQLSLRVAHVRPLWRAGTSINVNDTDAGNRSMQNVFVGLRTGPVVWLAEIDQVSDDAFAGGQVDQRAALIEANWLVRQGHNLKLAAEYFDTNIDVRRDEQYRYSMVWEYAPFQFVQLRTGLRSHDGPPLQELQNRSIAFIQVHAYF